MDDLEEDVCRLYANTMPVYLRDLSILTFSYLPPWIPRDDCVYVYVCKYIYIFFQSQVETP